MSLATVNSCHLFPAQKVNAASVVIWWWNCLIPQCFVKLYQKWAKYVIKKKKKTILELLPYQTLLTYIPEDLADAVWYVVDTIAYANRVRVPHQSITDFAGFLRGTTKVPPASQIGLRVRLNPLVRRHPTHDHCVVLDSRPPFLSAILSGERGDEGLRLATSTIMVRLGICF